jgi:hypothetical protein
VLRWPGVVRLFLLVLAVVLSPVRAMAATVPVGFAYDLAARSTDTTLIEELPAVRLERGNVPHHGYDGVPDRYDGSRSSGIADGSGALHSCNGALELADPRELRAVVAICDALVIAGAAEGAGAAESEFVNLASAQRTTHITVGDATGGGHMWPGAPGKTPFRQGWSADQIMHHVSDIATDPSLQWVQQTGKAGSLFTKSGAPARFFVTYAIVALENFLHAARRV